MSRLHDRLTKSKKKHSVKPYYETDKKERPKEFEFPEELQRLLR